MKEANMRTSFGRLVSILLLCTLVPAVSQGIETIKNLESLELPAVERRSWKFDGFPIIAWWPPPGTASYESFRDYRAAGFTIYPANPDREFEKAIKLAEQVDLPVIVWRNRQGFSVPKPEKPIVFPVDNPNIVGWITGDEPKELRDIAKAITAVNKLMRENPGHAAFFNMLPPRSQGNPGTEVIIDVAVRCGMPILSYDDYVIYDDGRNETKEHFDGLEIFRRASLEHDVPFWAFALTTGHDRYRRPSESDLRWQHYTNLAYGAKGLWYFTYWGPINNRFWDKNGIVNPRNGRRTKLYRQVKTLNRTVLAMGDILLRLTNDDVVHTKPPEGHRSFRVGQYWISDIVAKDALIGFFHDIDGTPYAMVVNKRHGMDLSAAKTADTIELTFAPEVKSVVAVNWLNGMPGPLALNERKASLRLYGGTGILLKAE